MVFSLKSRFPILFSFNNPFGACPELRRFWNGAWASIPTLLFPIKDQAFTKVPLHPGKVKNWAVAEIGLSGLPAHINFPYIPPFAI